MEEGRTRRDRLQSRLERAENQNEKRVVAELSAQLEVPPFPQALHYLWNIYTVLRGRKAPGFHGPNPVELHDIEAFLRLSRGRLAPWEITLLIEIDDLFLKEGVAKAEPAKEGEVAKASADDPDAVRQVMSAFRAGRRGKRVVANG